MADCRSRSVTRPAEPLERNQVMPTDKLEIQTCQGDIEARRKKRKKEQYRLRPSQPTPYEIRENHWTSNIVSVFKSPNRLLPTTLTLPNFIAQAHGLSTQDKIVKFDGKHFRDPVTERVILSAKEEE